ncbi:MBL fold metallo-hydrolase [Cellulomonas alba]|uniref:MBL fold metallo-hydrolase n=1 Tax=Cellulomonas alba TaxID=3053467 RepID=A0ABT7SBY5_9CELL|nr:MBL fold metallo-hydrolase [Cellulomonas alba]MDM7853695.1 MBL fold metallo-hydrolase [Cellulomonas alba]
MYATTSTVLVGRAGACLLVDPGVTADELVALAAELDARALRPVGRVVTHAHWDHVLTTPAWVGLPAWRGPSDDRVGAASADAFAPGSWPRALEAERDADAHLAAVAGGRPAVLAEPPLPCPGAVAPDGGVELAWHGPRTRLLRTPGHAPEHTSVWLPELRVLLAGDLLSDTEVPLLDTAAPDALSTYGVTLDRLRALGAGVVVPGHGSVAHGRDVAARVAADLTYLRDLAASREPDDARLETPWVAAEHARQRTALRV